MTNFGTTSVRLQMQQNRSAEGCSEPQEHVLVYWEDEGTYSVVTQEYVNESDYRYLNDVNVWWGKGKNQKLFPAKQITYGTKEDCETEYRIRTNTGKSDENSKKRKAASCSKELTQANKRSKQDTGGECSKSETTQKALDEEQAKLKEILAKKPEHDTRSFSHHDAIFKHGLSDIVQRLDSIENKLNDLTKSVRSFQNSSSRIHPEEQGSPSLQKSPKTPLGMEKCKVKQARPMDDDEEDDAEVEHDMVYNGIDLLGLKAPTREPTRYATKVAGVLFTQEELMTGMIPPVSDKGKKVEFDKEKISLLKKCIAKKYGEKVLLKFWQDIRRSVNQKGNDLRKKAKAVPSLDKVIEDTMEHDAPQGD